MQEDRDNETIRRAMSILGSRKSPAKAAASAANSKLSPVTKPGRVISEETRQKMKDAHARRRWIQTGIRPEPRPDCTCGRTDGTHKYDCPGYHRERGKIDRAKKLAIKQVKDLL